MTTLVCPCCGATASAEAWENDAVAREVMVAVAALPAPVPAVTRGYLALFRPEKQSLRWQKAGKIVAELGKMIATGYVQVQGKVARPCPPRIWAAAMEQMVERRESIRRPLPNHNYLKQVAWQLADEADARGEASRRQAEAAGGIGRQRTPGTGETANQTTPNPLLSQGGGLLSPMEAYIQGHREDKPSQEEMQEWSRRKLL